MGNTRLFVSVVAALALGAAAAADWPGFRGPTGDGVSAERGVPVTWGPKENVVWKTRLPGPGASSPIVLGDRVFVTCWTDYAVGAVGDLAKLRRHLLCVDRKSGKIIWDQAVTAKMPETEYRTQIREHGYASSTPVTDGERVYVFFGRGGVFAFGLDGKELWQADVGAYLNSWGSAASPVLYRDLVIVNASVESAALLALDKRTGKRVWRMKGLADNWSTPLLVEVNGRHELVLNTPGALLGIDPEKGVQLWECEGLGGPTAATPVARAGIVYAAAGGFDGRGVAAVRAGGRGDVTKTHLLWKRKAATGMTSPVLAGEHLYWVSGQVGCLKLATGEVVYERRLHDARREYVSPIAVDGKIIAFTRSNGAYVLAAGGKFEQLAHNDLGDASIFNASPAVSGGQLFVRSNEYLYCLGIRRTGL